MAEDKERDEDWMQCLFHRIYSPDSLWDICLKYCVKYRYEFNVNCSQLANYTIDIKLNNVLLLQMLA